MTENLKVIAEITTSVVGEGTSVSKFVKHAVKKMQEVEGIRLSHHAMGTIIEADNIDKIFEVAKISHESLFDIGVKRVITRLTIDDRRDKTRVMEDKIKSIE